MKAFLRSIRVIFLLVTIANSISAQEKNAEIDSLFKRANALGLFNGNVLIADHDKIIYHAAMGFADASKLVKLTEDYRFHIGSIAKEFNAVGIMMLKEQGKLSLEDRISKYMPELPSWADKITIKNLLQYTSGLPDVKWNSVKNDADNLEDIKNLDKLNFEPGTSYAYNNNNVFLQRRIIERITGMTFNEFVKEKILKPCGMNAALIDPTDKDRLVAKAFSDDGKQDPLDVPISGWTSVTLADFYRWAQCITNFKLISSESTRQILIPVAPNKQSGLGGGNMDGDKLINHIHDGSSGHYRALLTVNVPEGRTIILMSNNDQGSVYNLANTVNNILDNKPYQLPSKSLLKAYRQQLANMNGAEILAFYKKLKAGNSDDYGFNNEGTLNDIGYFLLGQNKLADAITVFEYNTQLFPNSGNVYDSLGEAYLKQGNEQKAVLNYKKSYQIDPSNTNARDIVAKLEK